MNTTNLSPLIDMTSAPPPAEWGVTVDHTRLSHRVEMITKLEFSSPDFDYAGVPDWEGDAWLDLAVCGTSVMACLWAPVGEQMWGINWEGRFLVDAPAIWGCFARFGSLTNTDGLDLSTLSALSPDAEFFAGEGMLQLVPQRIERLGEVSRTLLERFGGGARGLFEAADYQAMAVVQLLSEEVNGFSDQAVTDRGRLVFSKLSYLAVAVASARSPHPIVGMDAFPVYPDYMLPALFRYWGVIHYHPQLEHKVDNYLLIDAQSPQELAIRWATVYVGGQMIDQLHQAGNPVTGPQLDYWLWSQAVLGPYAQLIGPHHRTLTLSY